MQGVPAAESDRERNRNREGARRGSPRGSHGRAARALLVAAALVAPSLPAAAAPIDVFFRASDEVGITATSQAAVGGRVPTLEPDALFLHPGLQVVRSGEVDGDTGPPARGSTIWNVSNESDETFEDLWLVFRGHFDLHDVDGDGVLEDNDPLYDPLPAGRFGLQLESRERWALLEGSLGVYPAFFLGELAPGEGTTLSADVPLDYVFDGTLSPDADGTLIFPRLKVGYAMTPIPEPSTLGLLAVGGIGLAAAGRRRRR